MDRIATSAELLIVLGLEVETAVEIQRRTIFVQLGADAGSVREHKIDLFRARQERPTNARRGNAFGSFVLDPFNLRHHGMWLNRNAQDQFILDDDPRHRLLDRSGLRGKNAEQQWQQAQKRPRSHLVAHIVGEGFAALR